jgi:DNA-binding MarR family transcriptional regulator/N-acetylglutamate synthase-like GNAT family acetyltransferase
MECGAERVAAIRHFNRFYTRQIGVLEERLLKSPFSLTEVRVLYELAHAEGLTATRLRAELGLDAGYLSRILARFEERGLLARAASEADGRQSRLRLTKKGRAVFAPLNAAADEEIAALLAGLSEGEQRRLAEAMRTIERLLSPPKEAPAYVLRPPGPGDMGWIVHRQAVLYGEEYGWNEEYEALVAEITARFLRGFDPKRERCWIAERDGEIAGSVFLVKESEGTARLRLLYVEPAARGLGLGKRLVAECVRFARRVGYEKITLWTNDVLKAARRIYEAAGFQLVGEERHRSFGRDLVGQTWELAL